jgi:uncharacterized protein involved in tolerance to divalent cations
MEGSITVRAMSPFIHVCSHSFYGSTNRVGKEVSYTGKVNITTETPLVCEGKKANVNFFLRKLREMHPFLMPRVLILQDDLLYIILLYRQ